jgi:hypothetical protein
MAIADYTNMEKYREPIPRALAYLQKSQLPDGQMARYYELKTNRALYMFRQGENYSLTYDDSDLPDHYGWKRVSRLKEIAEAYESGSKGTASNHGQTVSDGEIRKIIQSLDDQGRWISDYKGERLVGQPKFKLNQPYLSSAVFGENIETLSSYLGAK